MFIPKMLYGIHLFATGDLKNILGTAQRTVNLLIDEGKLKGYRLPDSRQRRVHLNDLLEFMTKYGFPRTRLLRVLEDRGAKQKDLSRYHIKEPVGAENIRLYPEIPPYPHKPDILTTGDVAEYFHCAPRTVTIWCNKGILPSYRLPLGSKDRRISVDAVFRFCEQNKIDVPDELACHTFLSITYPRWEDTQEVASQGPNSLWYRAIESTKEASIRYGKDGLYIKLIDNIFNTILVGMTKREKKATIAHPQHIKKIVFYLNQKFDWVDVNNQQVQNAVDLVEATKRHFDDYAVTKLE
jgi:hypothetical protein